MSAPQGCTDDMDVVGIFKEALNQRIGADRFRMWFGHNVTFAFEPLVSSGDTTLTNTTAAPGVAAAPQDTSLSGTSLRGKVVVLVAGQFALDRLQKNFLTQLRGAAMQACGSAMEVEVRLHQGQSHQVALPMDGMEPVSASEERPDPQPRRRRRTVAPTAASQGRRGETTSLSHLVEGTTARSSQVKRRRERNLASSAPSPRAPLPGQRALPGMSDGSDKKEPGKKESARAAMTLQTFVSGTSNKLAVTAATMVCETPGVASPLFLCGPTGTGKTHLLSAIASHLRRRHRMRRVVHLSAEQFTNDFIASVSSSGITAFR